MKKVIATVLMMAVLASCKKETISGNGITRTETRMVNNFTAIDVNGKTNVTITSGAAFEVKVEAYETLLPYLQTNSVNGTLKIGYKDGTRVSNDNSHVYITLPLLTKVSATGVNVVKINAGASDDFEASLTGTPELKAFGFTAKRAKIVMEGAGMAELTVSEKLAAKITGSANIYYKGNPTDVTADITGNGKLVKQ